MAVVYSNNYVGKDLNYSGVLLLYKTWAREAAITIMIAASLLFLVLFFPVYQVSAWDLSTKVALGYDDNPGQEAAGEETFFTLYQLGCAQRFTLSEKFDLHASVYASYQDLVEVGDNFTGGLNIYLISPFWHGKGLATFFVNPEWYRDKYSREDEANIVNMGLETTYFLTPTLDLSGKGQISYVNYRNKVTPFSGHFRRGEGNHRLSPMPNSMAMNGLLPETMGNRDGVTASADGSSGQISKFSHGMAEDREDWLTLGELLLEKTLSEFLSLHVGTSYRSLHSTIDVESFDGIGVAAGLDWLPAELWSMSITGWWLRRVYDRAPGGDNRHDYERGVKLSLTRSLARFDLFVDFMMMRNQSPVDSEDYRRNVIQCGAIFLF
jgi:hypothetical protein